MTIKVDLLPTERRRFSFDPMMAFLFVIIILVTVGFVIYGSKLQNDIEARQARINEVEQEIRDIERNLPRIETLKSDIESLRKQIKMVTSLKYDSIRYGNLLREVGRVLPTNAWLASLSIEPGTQSITMNGTAAKMGGRLPLATIADLLENLNGSPYFKGASLASTSQTNIEGGLIGFTFQVETQYDADAAAQGLPSSETRGGGPVQVTPEDITEGVEAAPSPEGSPEGEASPSPGEAGETGGDAEGVDTAEVQPGEKSGGASVPEAGAEGEK